MLYNTAIILTEGLLSFLALSKCNLELQYRRNNGQEPKKTKKAQRYKCYYGIYQSKMPNESTANIPATTNQDSPTLSPIAYLTITYPMTQISFSRIS